MQPDLIATLVFIGFMIVFLIIKRDRLRIDYAYKPKRKKRTWDEWIKQRIIFILRYDTKWGIKWMQWFGKKLNRNWFKYVVLSLVVLSIIGIMVLIAALVYSLYLQIITPEVLGPTGGAALILPFKTKSQFYVPFAYWIISLIILMSVHELAHGIVAAVYKLKIKYTGFAFLCVLGIPILPAAFVDIDNKEMKKRPAKQIISIAGAGPLANIFLALIVFFIASLFVVPALEGKFIYDGVEVVGINDGSLAEQLGIVEGEIIEGIGPANQHGARGIATEEDLLSTLAFYKGQDITILTDKKMYSAHLETGKLGIWAKQKVRTVGDSVWTWILAWIRGLLYYLYILNLAVGLMNLLPAGFLDGGWIVNAIYGKVFSKRTTQVLMGVTTMIFVGLIAALLILK